MEYKGYIIERERGGWYLVTGPNGMWTADTVQEAKQDINELEKETERIRRLSEGDYNAEELAGCCGSAGQAI